jgi:hypothetical protein
MCKISFSFPIKYILSIHPSFLPSFFPAFFPSYFPSFPSFLPFLLFFKTRFGYLPRLILNSLGRLSWPQTHDPPTSAALVLGLQMCTAIPGFIINIFLCYHFVVCSSLKKAILTLIM